jgi:uncharacterized secreted repeat protein (TIGR03808 family)
VTTDRRNVDRRSVLTASLGVGVGAGLTAASAHAGPRNASRLAAAEVPASEHGLIPGAASDQAPALQTAIDAAAARGAPLMLPPGRLRTGPLTLRSGTRLIGAAGTTALEFIGDGSFLTGDGADGIVLEGLTLDGAYAPLEADGLVALKRCRGISLRSLNVARSAATGISLEACSGSVTDCTVTGAMQAGIHSLDAQGLDLIHNAVADCANNGIQVWRSDAGEDGSIVADNRIARIRADAGGSGQNGNGVNVFRAGGVIVSGNRITDCAYSAVRGNAASNIQIIANNCARLGEVALYAEFGFEGALISGNLVDTTASGISVTNFNRGGRLAIVQGNLIRNLFRREQEPEDKRGVGIAIEADTSVTGNVIENAPTAGIVVGWASWMRDVVATGNLIRSSRVGILVSPQAGSCLLANNMISGASGGAIRAMDGSGAPIGPDLASAGSSDARLAISGNFAV